MLDLHRLRLLRELSARGTVHAVAGALDIVVGDEYDGVSMPRPDDVIRTRLVDEQVRLVLPASHPLAREEKVALAELRDAAWACGQPGTSHRQVLVRTCRALGGFEP